MVEDEVVLENNLVKWFSKISSSDFQLAGVKGANLGELKKTNIPVPDGFVITTKSYEYFLKNSQILEKINSFLGQIDINNEDQIENYCSKIQDMILKTEFPEDLKEEILDSYEYLGTDKLEIEKGSALDILNNAAESIFVSVRSSLPVDSHRTNGLREQDTYLNVKGKEELLIHVKKCFASLFNINTVKRFLSQDSNFEDFRIAVVVQKMVEGEKSGIIYSRDSSENIVIRSIWGLGEGINLLEVNPDKFIVSRNLDIVDEKIEEKNFGVVRDAGGNLKKVELSPERSSRASLSYSEMQRLGDLAEKIEDHFSRPQEIEFCISENNVFILQSKDFKIENLEVVTKEEDEEKEEKEEFEGEVLEENDLIKPVLKNYENKEISRNLNFKIDRVEKMTKTKLNLIVDSVNFLEDIKGSGLKKVGMFKLENLIKNNKKHPFYYIRNNYIHEYENLIFSGIEKVTQNFKEVWVRTSDFLSNEFSNLEGAPQIKENNPLLGLHGIRYGIRNLEILESELRALKRVNTSQEKIGILLPNVSSLDELQKVRDILIDMDFDPKIGIVLETPAAVQMIKDFTDSNLDLIYIDTDKLLQHLIGIDFSNKDVEYLYDPMHPALMYQLEYVVRVCRRRDVKTFISGKALDNEDLVKYLVQKEVSGFCVLPEDARDFSDLIYEFEEEIFSGTDKEPRDYEIKKEKEEYIEEAPRTMEDLEILEESQKNSVLDNERIEEDIEKIEEEKNEYLENHPDEKEEEKEEDSLEELVSENDNSSLENDELKEHSLEDFEEVVEEHEEEDPLGIL